MLSSSLGLGNLPTCRQSALSLFALAVGWGTLFFSKCSQIFIIGAREFRFVAKGAEFIGAQSRGPRLFCRTSRKKVIPGKPRKKLTFAYSHVTVDSELIRNSKPVGPVRSSAEFKSPLLSYSTPSNPP